MDENHRKAAALSLIEDDETEYIRIHSSKMDVKLLQDIFFKLKHIDEDENWLYASPHTVNFYMTFLANHIAKKNSLSLWTRNQELWTTSTYFLYGGALQDDYRPGKEYIEPSTEALVSIMIPDIFPQDLLHVPPTDILRFREKRKDERNQFLNAIKTLRNELAQADAPEVIEAIINDEKKKIDSAANEYRKSMDILRVAKFGGILTTVITVAADVLGYCSNFPDLYKGAIESSGLWAGILTGIFEKRVGNINNPYTYLAQIKSTFSYYPGASIYDLHHLYFDLKRLIMLMDGQFYPITSVTQDGVEITTSIQKKLLPNYFSADFMIGENNRLINFDEVLSETLFSNWCLIQEELDIVHNTALYCLSRVEMPVT